MYSQSVSTNPNVLYHRDIYRDSFKQGLVRSMRRGISVTLDEVRGIVDFWVKSVDF